MSSRDYMDVMPPAGLRVPYGPDPEQFGDLRIPEGAGPHPVVVVIHGGWWRAMYGLTYAGHLCEALTAAGYATWNIEYRRVGHLGGGFPGTLDDVARAVAELATLATGYDLDLSRVVVTGHSAGGHLAAWLASKAAHPALDRFGTTPRLIGAVPVAGVLDLDLTSELRIESNGEIPVHDFMGGSSSEVPERYALASPARLLPAGIPVVVIHGDADDAVPLAISERYVERAQAAGDPARLIVLPGVDHLEPFDPTTPAGKTVCAAIGDLIPSVTAR
jgi:acetyl esterase/lipase